MENKLILPKVINKKKAIKFFIDNDMKFIVDEYTSSKKTNIFKPNILDLYHIYKIITLNKRLSVLEYGCGWSSLVISQALKNNKTKYSILTEKLRKNNKFELHIFDNYKNFLNITKKNFKRYLPKNSNAKFFFSKCLISTHKGCYSSIYQKKIKMNPDLIYLDGPSQFGLIENKKISFNTNIKDFMPMSADILKYEFFLVPGTIIIIDGRGANVIFLRKMLKRDWKYKYNKSIDQHYLLLSDKSIGKHNDKLFSFWNS